MEKSIRWYIYDYLEPEPDDSFAEKIFNCFVMFMIIINVIVVALETVPELAIYNSYFDLFEILMLILFSLEYVLRVWTIKEKPKYSGKNGRWKYIFSLTAIIDLISIIPFISVKFFGCNQMWKTLSFIRLLKLGRYSKSLTTLKNVYNEKKSLLLASFGITLFMIIFSSFLIYMAEGTAQPDKYTSVPQSMYWSVITLTSVGYGDIYPITTMGKILTGFVGLLGISMAALPAGIMASGFAENHNTKTEKSEKQCIECPYKKIVDEKMSNI